MTVVLNESALVALLETQEGPVGRFVERVATRVQEDAERKFDDYFSSANLPPQQNVGLQMEGSSAVVGYLDVGNKARRIAAAEAEGRLRIPPIQSSLEAVRAGL